MAAAVDPLSVDVDIRVTVEGRECAVWDEGDTVVVNAPTLGVARALLDGAEALPLPADQLTGELERADLVVELRVRRAPVARLGAGVAPSPLAARLGYDADVSLRGLAVAAGRALM